ncbi:CHAT domain-containing protein [Amycolatopsis sp. NPDC058340]|uniref:CHAT domain-containing protein n=1 Tax=Amycolatopsis sp. NPDC058340 TaxID=3346453 RepID=UPI00364D92B3
MSRPQATVAASIVILLTVALPASAQQDAVPTQVYPGSAHDIVKYGVAADEGCMLYFGGGPSAPCSGTSRGPLRGRLTVDTGQPPGPTELHCQPCHRVGAPSTSTRRPPTTSTGPVTTSESPSTSPPTTFTSPPVEESSPKPPAGYARRPAGTRIHLATVTVLAAPGTAQPTPAPSVENTPLLGLPSRTWLAILAGLLLAAAALAGLRFVRRRGDKPPPLQPPTGLPEPGIRPVRVGISDLSGSPAPLDIPLTPDTGYVLWVDIGELPGADTGREVPLDVVAFDSTPAGLRPMVTGTPTRRVGLGAGDAGRVGFDLRTPARSARRRLRLGLYCRGVLWQSFAVEADVGWPEESGGWRAERDYVAAYGLDPSLLDTAAPHALSIMVNHNTADEHGIHVLFADGAVPMAAGIPAAHLDRLQGRARDLYRRLEAAQGSIDSALGALALHGRNVYTAIRPRIDPALVRAGLDPVPLWQRLRDRVRVQVIWPDGCAQPLPAAIVYDYPLAEVGSAELRACRAFFDDLAARIEPRCFGGRCVSDSDTVVCPAGFWGFRLLLGSPPSLGTDRPVPDRPVESADPPALVLGKAMDPAFVLRDRHLRRLRELLPGVAWYEENRRAGLLARLRAVQPSLIYLYCHGGVDEEQGIGWVEIGDGERLSARGLPDDLYRQWRSRPLVLLNGCSTAALGDDQPNPLTQRLLWAGAGGIVGTEIDVGEKTACRFADHLVPLMLGANRELGDAIRASRLELLRIGSVAGLSYLALARPDLRLTVKE